MSKRINIWELIEKHQDDYDYMTYHLVDTLRAIGVITDYGINKRFQSALARYPEVRADLKDMCPEGLSPRAQITFVCGGYDAVPKCVCGSDCTFSEYKGTFNEHCSRSCAGKSRIINNKHEKRTDEPPHST